MEGKINIGILGCASIAKRMVIPNILDTGKFNLIAVSSRTEEKATLFANEFSCEAIIGYNNLLARKDIKAVYIPLPTGLHFEWIMKALKAGKHVFSEKSISCSLKETKEIIALANEKKLCVFENFMFPFHSQIDFVKEKINESMIGEIKQLRSSFGFPLFDNGTNIRYSAKLGGGALLDVGAYTLMAAQLFLGRNQEVISCVLNKEGHDVDFQGSIVLVNDENTISQLSFGFDNFYQNNIELWGNKGKLIIDRAFTAGPDYMPRIIIEKQDVKTEHILNADNHFKKILDKFFDAIQNDYSFQYEQILKQSALLTQAREKNYL